MPGRHFGHHYCQYNSASRLCRARQGHFLCQPYRYTERSGVFNRSGYLLPVDGAGHRRRRNYALAGGQSNRYVYPNRDQPAQRLHGHRPGRCDGQHYSANGQRRPRQGHHLHQYDRCIEWGRVFIRRKHHLWLERTGDCQRRHDQYACRKPGRHLYADRHQPNQWLFCDRPGDRDNQYDTTHSQCRCRYVAHL